MPSEQQTNRNPAASVMWLHPSVDLAFNCSYTVLTFTHLERNKNLLHHSCNLVKVVPLWHQRMLVSGNKHFQWTVGTTENSKECYRRLLRFYMPIGTQENLQCFRKTDFLTVTRQYIKCRVPQKHVNAAALSARDGTTRVFFARDDQSWAARCWSRCSNWA